MNLGGTSQDYNFVPSSVVSDATQDILNIIEFNSGAQTDTRNGHTVITWLDGVPSEVKKYTDNTLVVLTDTIALTWLNGVPTTIVRTNHLDILTITTTIAWLDGVPVSITKV